MVNLLMRMRRALCWMHLEAMCRLRSLLEFTTMLAMALNSVVLGNFLGFSFIWVIPVELSLDRSNGNLVNFVSSRTSWQKSLQQVPSPHDSALRLDFNDQNYDHGQKGTQPKPKHPNFNFGLSFK